MSIIYTPNYNLAKPADKTEKNVWGPILGGNWDAVDTAMASLQSQIDAISVVGSDTYTAQSMAEIRGLTTLTFPGIAITLISYQAGARQGGGLFLYNAADITSPDDGGTIAVDLSSRRWYRVFEGAVTPSMFGALNGSGQPDQSAAFNAMHNYINANTSCHSCDIIGVWNLNGGLVQITRNEFHYYSSGYAKINRLTNGKMLNFSGSDVGVGIPRIKIDGGLKDDAPITVSGARPYVFFTETYNTSAGQGLSIASGVDGPIVFFNTAHDTNKGGIGIGKTIHGIFGVNGVWNTGAEGMPGDELEKAIVIANFGHDTHGIGFLGMDKAYDCSFVANLGYGHNNNGIASGDNKGSSSWLTMTANVMVDNDHYGIDMKAKYARWSVTGISKAPTCVITYQSIAITGITKAYPCVVTATAHGRQDGDRVKINGVVGMTEVNGIVFRVDKLTNDTFAIYNEITYLPVNSTAYGTYTSGGTLNHPFNAGDRLYTTGVVGMVEINTLSTFVSVTTLNTVSLLMDDNLTPLNSTLFTTYISGGLTENGAAAQFNAAVANILRGNGDGAIHIGSAQPLFNSTNHIIHSNQMLPAQAFLGPFITDNMTLGRSEDFEAHVNTSTVNVTGDGTPYTVLFARDNDGSGIYNQGTGIVTLLHGGRYFFKTTVGVQGAGGATSGTLDIVIRDIFGNLLNTYREFMHPAGSLPASSQWYGTVNIPTIYLDGASTVRVILTMGGLGKVVNLIADMTTNFCGGLRA